MLNSMRYMYSRGPDYGSPFVLKVDTMGATDFTFGGNRKCFFEWQEEGNPANKGKGQGNGPTAINFGADAVYILKIWPKKINGLNYMNASNGDPEKIIDVLAWGDVKWISFNSMFKGTVNLQAITAGDLPVLKSLPNPWECFKGSAITHINRLGEWNIGALTSITGFFKGASVFDQDLGGWDTGNITDASSLFEGATAFNNGGNDSIKNWNTGNIEDMKYLFKNASAFNQHIGGWDTGNVTEIQGMFYGASAFNQDVGGWDVSGVSDFFRMFYKATNFNNGGSDSIKNWNMGNATDIGWLFWSSSFNQPIGTWDVRKVTTMKYIFRESPFNQDLSDWKLESLTEAGYTFFSSSMSCKNYSKTLVGWAVYSGTAHNVNFEIQDPCEYSPDIVIYRDYLINTLGWTINGDVQGTCNITQLPPLN